MKIIGAVIAALCLLSASCKNETTPNETNTTTSTAATITETAAARRPTAMAAFTAATELTVSFVGLNVFVLGNGVERATVLRAGGGHHQQIIFPQAMETTLKAMFSGVTCSGGRCFVPFDGRAFRVVDASGSPSTTPFVQSKDFKLIVTHLAKVPGVGNAFNQANINSDVFDKPKKGKFIAGFFELSGGSVDDVIPFTCTAHFDGQAPSGQQFPRVVKVKFPLSSSAKLQVFEGGTSGWVDVVTLTTLPSPLFFTVDNNVSGAASHFGNYAGVSKSGVHLPDVKPDDPKCIEGSGDVAGCSDSQWP